MSFSLFTRRSNAPSKRLRILGDYLQFCGIIAGTALVGYLIAYPFQKYISSWESKSASRLITLGAMGLSLFLIGHGLKQRQRWAAYLAAATYAIPLFNWLLTPQSNIPTSGIVTSTLALCAIASAWNELGSVRDNEVDALDHDSNRKPAKRNPGLGEKCLQSSSLSDDVTPQSARHLDDRLPPRNGVKHAPTSKEI